MPTPVLSGPIHWVYLLKKRFCPRGEGDFVPDEESQGDGGISGLLLGHFQKIKKNSPTKKSSPFLTEKLNVLEAFEVLAR